MKTVWAICYLLGKRKIKTYVFVFVWFCLKTLALASVAQLAGALSHSQKVVGSIPDKGTYLGCGSRHVISNQSMLFSCINVSPSLFLSLKAMKKYPWVRIKIVIKYLKLLRYIRN